MIMTIRTRREAAGMTQQALGMSMGVSQANVAMWEAEVALPKARDLPLLARVLGCSIDDLYDKGADSGAAGPPDQLEAC